MIHVGGSTRDDTSVVFWCEYFMLWTEFTPGNMGLWVSGVALWRLKAYNKIWSQKVIVDMEI